MPAGPESEAIRDLIRYTPLLSGVGLSVFTAVTTFLRWQLLGTINEGLKYNQDEVLWPNATVETAIQQERSNLSRMEWLWFQPRLPKDIDIYGIQQASRALLTACVPSSQMNEDWVSAGKQRLVEEVDKVGRSKDFLKAQEMGIRLARWPVKLTLDWVIPSVIDPNGSDDSPFPDELGSDFDARELLVKRIGQQAVAIVGLAMGEQVLADQPDLPKPFSSALGLHGFGVAYIQVQKEQMRVSLPVIKNPGEYGLAYIDTPGIPELQNHPPYIIEALAA